MDKTYSVEQKPFGKFTEYRLINNKNGAYVSVIPELGAILNQVCLFANNKLHELVAGSETYEELITTGLKYFHGSKLLPYPNRINHAKYEFNGKTYEVPMNEPERQNSLHGLVYDKPWTVASTSADENSAKIVLSYDFDGSHEGYPFKYSAKNTFELNEKGFTSTATLTSKDDKDLPIGEGTHPYYKTGSKIDSWTVTLPKCEMLEVDDRLIPTMKIQSFDKFEKPLVFGDQFFDSCFALDSTHSNIATMEIVDKEVGIKLSIWQEVGPKKYNYLQVYTPPHRNFMAIEAMTCAPDTFNNKLGLIVLKPGETVEFAYGLSVSELTQ